ncbi:putative E3 ubiquitin-protein ligase LIN-1 isoform X1 [Amborella trichopoda]|uniref:putative E3 ubiquitin-protein ligase LIN-1 isoform X1 n=1 Tax=Amborella trichopoda TaxID=13333 RepID=UPI0005D44945|nr:putative E3 ubiquitin-protein ligase LIN-1 isoform X1 [Amborella trichopoda]|eukprot:XP_011621981.1 putative E3 ubiquitin-protein ligase LIN-1 isoform X1 [Amborella trichopoda]
MGGHHLDPSVTPHGFPIHYSYSPSSSSPLSSYLPEKSANLFIFSINKPSMEEQKNPIYHTELSRSSEPSKPSSSRQPPPSCEHNFHSVQVLVSIVSTYIAQFLNDFEKIHSLQVNFFSGIASSKKPVFFEFSDQAILANLYWGVQALEKALPSKNNGVRISKLRNAEKLLQVPALIDEHGTTNGVSNRYIVAYAYFYLSMVWKLQRDEWQMTHHLLHAFLVNPGLVRKEILPELWEKLFFPHINDTRNGEVLDERERVSPELDDDLIDEKTRWVARRYKDLLMYHCVVAYGGTPQPLSGFSRGDECQHSDLFEREDAGLLHYEDKGVYPLGTCGNINEEYHCQSAAADFSSSKTDFRNLGNERSFCSKVATVFSEIDTSLKVKCLQDFLRSCQSNTFPYDTLSASSEGGDKVAMSHHGGSSLEILTTYAEEVGAKFRAGAGKLLTCGSITPTMEARKNLFHEDTCEVKTSDSSSRSHNSLSDLNSSYSPISCPCHEASLSIENDSFSLLNHRRRAIERKLEFSGAQECCDAAQFGIDNGRFVKAVILLCSSKGLRESENAVLEISTIWGSLESKREAKTFLLRKDVINQLLCIVSDSKMDIAVRDSISILSVLIKEDWSIMEPIKKDKKLYAIACALKRKIFEASVLIYLLKPSPSEMRSLELLPALVEVISCSNHYIGGPILLPLRPSSASMMMIRALVTAFDALTNNKHLSEILSLRIIPGLININNIEGFEERVSSAAILVKCMKLDGTCRNFLSQVISIAPYVYLLQSNDEHAKSVALEFFSEILCLPRPSAITLLRQIRNEGSISIMHTLMACIPQVRCEHRPLAAILLLQLDMLDDLGANSVFREAAIEVLLESVTCEGSVMQIMSASSLANLGGNFTWTGEPSIVARLVKRAGLISLDHWHVMRDLGPTDQSLQEYADMESWYSKIARSIILTGNSAFYALRKGLQSNIHQVSRDCLIAIAWIGCEFAAMGRDSIGYSACEILLPGVIAFLHPGSELEERLLACMSVYNYALVEGLQKLIKYSEELGESLRRLSSITWIAEELYEVIDYSVPSKLPSPLSCAHKQLLEAGSNGNGAAHALLYYKGQLCSGHSDGSIKVWEIKQKKSKLVQVIREHKKAVTCFALYKPGDSLLSGSTDKTVRIWQMVHRNLECIAVVELKESVRKVDAFGKEIFVITHASGIKVCDASGVIKVLNKKRRVQSISVAKGKLYIGFRDSSIQEVDLSTNCSREINGGVKSWIKSKPVNSIAIFKDWIYSAGATVKGSNVKVWRRKDGSTVLRALASGSSVYLMAVVEDFIYLTCSSASSILQIWLREKCWSIGRISAGCKIASLLAANDVIFCGLENGLIKGWIPV